MSERLRIVCEIAEAGGKLALDMRHDLRVTIKSDNSPVTNADTAVQDLVVERLAKEFPEAILLGEENDLIPENLSGPIFAIDPIDGTDSYQRGFPHFGVSIGLIENKKCTLGVFYNPVLKEMYAVDSGESPTLNGEPFRIDESVSSRGPLLVPSNFHQHYRTSFEGKVRGLGSMAHHLCYVACGRACATLAYETHIWDLAAGVALVEGAGGRMAMLNGDVFDPTLYLDGAKILDPMLICPASLWKKMQSCFEKI